MPAYKVANMGVENMTNVELLSLLIGGTAEKAMDTARNLLAMCDGKLANMARLQPKMMAECEGLGTAKINAIMAAMELGRRRQAEQQDRNNVMDRSCMMAEIVMAHMQDLDHEVAEVILMNNSMKLIKTVRISEGGLTETAMDVRMILKEAIINNATVIALAHNHPSGNRRPSGQDDQITRNIKEACRTMRITLIDHIIIAGNDYYSYADEGRL